MLHFKQRFNLIETMTIKILGSGCPNCQLLEAQTKKAVKELGLKDILIEHVYDIDKIIEMGITFTPALVINDEVKIMGQIPPVETIKSLIQESLKTTQ